MVQRFHKLFFSGFVVICTVFMVGNAVAAIETVQGDVNNDNNEAVIQAATTGEENAKMDQTALTTPNLTDGVAVFLVASCLNEEANDVIEMNSAGTFYGDSVFLVTTVNNKGNNAADFTYMKAQNSLRVGVTYDTMAGNYYSVKGNSGTIAHKATSLQ